MLKKLQKDTFLLSTAKGIAEIDCSFLDDSGNSETNKAAVYLVCQFKWSAVLKNSDVTKRVFFDDAFYKKFCKTYTIESCSDSGVSCDENSENSEGSKSSESEESSSSDADDVTMEVNWEISKHIRGRKPLDNTGALIQEASSKVKTMYTGEGCTNHKIPIGFNSEVAIRKTTWSSASYCEKKTSTSKDKDGFLKEAVSAWMSQMSSNYKFAGDDQQIVDGCKSADGTSNEISGLEVLLRNTFLIIAGKNSQDISCAYYDNTNADPWDAKTAQYVSCYFSQKTIIAKESLTQYVYFDETMFNAFCYDNSNPKMHNCGSYKKPCLGVVINDVTSNVIDVVTKTVPERPKLEVGSLAVEAYVAAMDRYTQIGCVTSDLWTLEGMSHKVNHMGKEILSALTVFCYKGINDNRLEQSQAVETGVNKWIADNGTYKYAGADKKIVTDCLDSNNKPVLKINNLKTNTFLLVSGANSKNSSCAFVDNIREQISDANKKAQFLVCFFELETEIADSSITQDVFFADDMFQGHCDAGSVPQLHACANAKISCVAGSPTIVSQKIMDQINKLIPARRFMLQYADVHFKEESSAALDHMAGSTGCVNNKQGQASSGEKNSLFYSMTSYCDTTQGDSKPSMDDFLTHAVQAWIDGMGSYKYAGAVNAIVDGCLASDGSSKETNLKDLQMNTFLVVAGDNTADLTCNYIDVTDSGQNSIKAQYVVCYFKLIAQLTDQSITHEVFFDDQMYNAYCDANSKPMMQKCSNNKQGCTPWHPPTSPKPTSNPPNPPPPPPPTFPPPPPTTSTTVLTNSSTTTTTYTRPQLTTKTFNKDINVDPGVVPHPAPPGLPGFYDYKDYGKRMDGFASHTSRSNLLIFISTTVFVVFSL
ncbi:uncharacterized protein LOC142344240 isoform X2 [Convolutriloba macropyga]|uniref:uncharacterized protein LOC142344240 isoform X2 n=1 Tax=Convolutriloba macropyga TaxID=536237 RepID=UPI003F51CDE1